MSVEADISEADNLFAGEDKTVRFTVYDSAGLLQSIVGWTISWKWYDKPAGSVLLTKSGTIVDGPNGILEVTIAAADTGTMAAPKTYYHTLTRTDSGSFAVLSHGNVLLQAK